MSLLTLEGFPSTSAYHIKAEGQNVVNANGIAKDILFFIPGNPGLVEYYITYLDLIHEKYPHFEIYCLSHAGYQTTDNYQYDNEEYYDINYQIDHKYKIIKDLVDEESNIHFLGHSMGTFVMQKLIKKLIDDDLKVKFIGLICPTIVNLKDSDSGKKFQKLYRWLPIIKLGLLFSWFLSLFSENFIKYLFGSIIFDEPKVRDSKSEQSLKNSIDASFKLVTTPRIVRQALTLVVDELDMILQDDELNDWFFGLSKEGIKIWTYFAFKDHWIHDNTRDYILSRYFDEKNSNLLFELGDIDGITHSFCVNQSVEFAEITLNTMSQLT